jgi:hypothetical protein
VWTGGDIHPEGDHFHPELKSGPANDCSYCNGKPHHLPQVYFHADIQGSGQEYMKWNTKSGHLNRGDIITS